MGCSWVITICIVLFVNTLCESQTSYFALNGSAVDYGTGEYLLTPATARQVGSIWYNDKVSLSQSFILNFELYFGTSDGGADGMTFCLQPVSTSIGISGAGLGIQGVTPSFFAEFDTYQNAGDPRYDHVALQKNGDVHNGRSNNLAPPVRIKDGVDNVENGQWYPMQIRWDAAAKRFEVYVDCQFRIGYTGDIVNTIFNGNDLVYWGFSASTGGRNNVHKVRNINTTLIEIPDQTICAGGSVQVTIPNTGNTFSWNTASGVSSTTSLTPTLSPASSTEYVITYSGFCSSEVKDTFQVNVEGVAVTLGNDTTICEGSSLALTASGGASYRWSTGATGASITVNNAGTYSVTATSPNGCTSQGSITVATVDCSCEDNDNDGVCDDVDLDDDNDGILDVNECMTSNFQWSSPPQVTGNLTATGNINGVPYTYTSTRQVNTEGSIQGFSRFPSFYGIPNTTNMMNVEASSNTLSFGQPIQNPVLVFASIGAANNFVSVNFNNPFEILWSENVSIDSERQITGNEGFAIIRFNGTYSQLSFDYSKNEYRANFYFGADFATFCDTDGDGTPDYLDADSDGDGCLDALEGGAGFKASALNGNQLSGGVDLYGVPLVAGGSGQAVGSSVNSAVKAAECIIDFIPTDTLFVCKGQSVDITAEGVDVAEWSGAESFAQLNDSTIKAQPAKTTYYYLSSFTKKQNALVNGDFESPNLGGFQIVDANTIDGWNTTASDNKIEVWPNGFLGVPAYSGQQFVELNANMQSALYQDMPTTPGTKLMWGFAHRGRNGIETVDFEVGPPGGPYVKIGSYSDGKAWGYYNGVYEVPAGQSTTRFYYSSKDPGASGNLLDAIEFFTLEEEKDSVLVIVRDVFSVDLGKDTFVCEGESIILKDLNASSGNYAWSEGSAADSLVIFTGGDYSLKVTDPNGCEAHDTVKVIIDYNCKKSLCGQDVNYNTWSQKGHPDFGNWVVSSDGKRVTQTVNSSPTFFIGNRDHINVRFSGQMRVGSSDDDWIGMVFGFESPDSPITSYPFTIKTLVMSWKQARQIWSGQVWPEGFSLFKVDKVINNRTDLENLFRLQQAAPGEIEVLATNYEPDGSTGLGWKDNTDHQIMVDYTSSNITVFIDGTEVINVNGCFAPGKIGFFNDSQEDVTYSNFTYQYKANIVSDRDTVCIGDPIQLSVNGGETCPFHDYYPEGTQYAWEMGDGQTYSLKDSVGHTYQSAGKYTVKLTLSDASTCVSEAEKELWVGAYPTINLGKDTTICFGDSITLEAKSNANNFEWNNGDTTRSIRVQQAEEYWVKAMNEFLCVTADTLTLGVHDLPVVDITNDTTICQGDTIMLDAKNNGATYQWTNGQKSQNVKAAVEGVYKVVVTDPSGCENSDSLYLTVQDLPVFDLGGDQRICKGTTTVLTVNIPGLTYQWSNGATSQEITIADAGQYKAEVRDNLGCYYADSMQLNVNPLPVVNLGSDTSLCEWESLTLNAKNDGHSYLWNTGAVSQTITLNSAGQYGVSVKDSIGCEGRDSMNVLIDAVPDPFTEKDFSFCEGDTLLLTPVSYPFDDEFSWLEGSSNSDSILVWKSGVMNGLVVSYHCQDTFAVNVSVLDTPDVEIVDLSGQIHYCFDYEYPTLEIQGEDAGIVEAYWKPSEEYGISIQAKTSGIHTLEVNDGYCASVYQTILQDYCDPQLYIPNAFSPNDDGQNDVFKPVTKYVTNYLLLIYDRWGNVVFRSTNPEEGWDGNSRAGNPMEIGVYVYKLEYGFDTERGGENGNEFTGTVTLVR